MRKSAIIRLILFSVLAMVLIGILLSGIMFKFFSFTDRKFEKLEQTVQTVQPFSNVISFPASIEDIRISWHSGTITVDTADTAEITVAESGDVHDHSMSLRSTDSTLMILYQDEDSAGRIISNLFNIGNNPKKDLQIIVPKDWNGKVLTVDSVSADLTVAGIQTEEVKVNSVSTCNRFQDCKLGNLEFSGASGTLTFDGSIRQLKLEGVSTDCTVTASNTPEEIEVEAVSSNLNLTLPDGSGFTVQMDDLAGKFTTDFETTKQDNRYTCGNGECSIQISGVSPTVAIHRSDEK